MKPIIYLDNAATTPLSPIVFEAMKPYFIDQFYNPSANYEKAHEINILLQQCRETIASTLGCEASEIYFTSGGSESNNWALRFVRPGQHIITSKIEHHSILNTCKYLETQGVEVTYVEVDRNGFVDPIEFETSIQSNTTLASIMTANNEIGTIQKITKLAEIASEHNVQFHTDAVQAYGHMSLDVNLMGIDMLSASAHKFNGPKGVGFLYVSNRIPLKPLIYGGDQQFGKRAGTENVPGIVGMTRAVELAYENISKRNQYVYDLRNSFKNRILSEIPNVSVNGSDISKLANNLNVSFAGVRGEQLLTLLSMNGICASTGSACDTSSGEPSHVLKAIGLSDEEANSSIRFTLSDSNTKEEIDYAVDVLKRCVEDLRRV